MRSARIILLTVLLSVASLAQARSTLPPQQRLRTPHRGLRIGLVLSGGGARGAAHIGVLKLLDQLHVPIDAIAGTSMGAVVGGLYASGMSGEQIEQAMASVDWQAAFRDRPPRDELDYRRKQEEEQLPGQSAARTAGPQTRHSQGPDAGPEAHRDPARN